MKELEEHIARLPKQSHQNLAKLLTKSKGQINLPANNTNSSAYRLRPLFALRSTDINLPDEVVTALKQSQCNLVQRSSNKDSVPRCAADYYEFTCLVETRRKVDRILWRFLTAFYYDLVSELDTTRHLPSRDEEGGIAFVVAVICQPGKINPISVREKVKGWVKIGRRYRGYMDALCPGCVILFPDEISELV